MMGAPTTDTASLVTIGGSAQFNGLGYLSALTIGDSGIWEMDYYDISADSFANAYPVMTAASGIPITYYNLYYQIDRGSGFSAWKNLYYQATGATGASGQPIITGLSTTTDIAVGNDVSALGVAGVPDGTKVLTVDSASQITLDTNLTAALSSAILIFRETPNETTFPSTGVKLKVKAYVFATPTQAISGIWIPMLSTSTSRARLYPQAVDSLAFTLSGLPSGTTVALYDNADTELLREDNITSGTFEYNYVHSGADITDVYYVVWHPDYVPFKSAPFDLTATDLGLSYTPVDDPIYDAAHDDRYTIDFANKRIVMEAGETQYDVPGAYSHWKDQIFLADNFTYDFAFTIKGGVAYASPKEIPAFTALINSWKIRPDEANHTLIVENGILYVEGGGDPFVDTLGAYTVRINYSQPVEVLLISTGSGVLPSDITDIADAVQTVLDDDFAAIPTAAENATAVQTELDDDFAALTTDVAELTDAQTLPNLLILDKLSS